MHFSDRPTHHRIDFNDRIVLVAIVCLLVGVLVYGQVYDTLALGAGIGAVLMAVSVAVALASKGSMLSQVALPVLGMAMEALMIQVSRGHTEAHFGVFAFLACLVVYRSTVSILVGAAVIAVHHASFNQLQTLGWGPMCFTDPGWGRVVEHALYVVVEAIVLLFLAARARAEFRVAEELMVIADQVHAADGRVDFTVVRSPAHGRQSRRLLDVLEQVNEAIKQVRASAEVILQGCIDITQGNQALRGRTESASASIAETASAVEQIAVTIRASASHANEANALAGTASEVAQQGGEAVSRVVETMSGIQQSSRKITDIIGVIDGIAFQTNILALNAAVEAARAGEQGRGFAVVAGEVRTLARRSADAAKEIKQLITRSVDQVEAGSGMVDGTGRIIGDVVEHVRRVSTLVGQITQSSTEQGLGMGQINDAIGRLEQSTQQNAGLVETTAEAAERLRRQAEGLVTTLATFRTAA